MKKNCELIEYNYTIEKAKCSCDIKSNMPDNYDFKFNKDDFFKSFIDIKNIANLSILWFFYYFFFINIIFYNTFYILVIIIYKNEKRYK